jgi:hypothetical protein
LRRHLITLLAALLAAAATTSVAIADRGGNDRGQAQAYSIGLWGDMPYSDVQSNSGVPNLIADMNKQNLAFTVHDGDIKNGSARCDDPVYTQALGYFNSLSAPAVFTPGDNDWTDCDRVSAGSYNSLERLDHERSLFFDTPYSLGKHRMRLEVQQSPKCLDHNGGQTTCVENRRWSEGGVTYATFNVQGSCNNRCGDAPDDTEYQARNAADIAWLHDTFAEARRLHSAGVMVIFQADPGWDQSDPTRAPVRNPQTLDETDGQPDGFKDFLSALRDETISFRRPVAAVHGDSHYFRIDKPFLDSGGRRLENFTRVETFGDHQENGNNDVNWLKVTVDPRSREVFSYQPQIVPGNRTAVPAP